MDYANVLREISDGEVETEQELHKKIVAYSEWLKPLLGENFNKYVKNLEIFLNNIDITATTRHQVYEEMREGDFIGGLA